MKKFETIHFHEFVNKIMEYRASSGKNDSGHKINPTYDFNELREYRLNLYKMLLLEQKKSYQNRGKEFDDESYRVFTTNFWHNEIELANNWIRDENTNNKYSHARITCVSEITKYIQFAFCELEKAEDLTKQAKELDDLKFVGEFEKFEDLFLDQGVLTQLRSILKETNAIARDGSDLDVKLLDEQGRLYHRKLDKSVIRAIYAVLQSKYLKEENVEKFAKLFSEHFHVKITGRSLRNMPTKNGGDLASRYRKILAEKLEKRQ